MPFDFVDVHSGLEIGRHSKHFRLIESNDLMEPGIGKVFSDDLAPMIAQKSNKQMERLLCSASNEHIPRTTSNSPQSHYGNNLGLQFL